MINEFKGDYRFLSNFYESVIEFEGETYPTVEHAYQAAKTENTHLRRHIATCPSAGDAKRDGRALVLRSDWDDVKLPIMLRLLQKKFRDSDLARLLLATKDQELVEGNYWHDNFWGNCTCVRCSNIEGSNHLGKLLVQVREEIKSE